MAELLQEFYKRSSGSACPQDHRWLQPIRHPTQHPPKQKGLQIPIQSKSTALCNFNTNEILFYRENASFQDTNAMNSPVLEYPNYSGIWHKDIHHLLRATRVNL